MSRRPIQNPGIGKGAPGVPRGSSLSSAARRLVAARLEDEHPISQIARELDVSRDQVRTVKRYQEGQLSRPSRSRRCA